jgi:hypothetical protein
MLVTEKPPASGGGVHLLISGRSAGSRAASRLPSGASQQRAAAIVELMAVVDLFSGFNKLMDGLRVEPDEKPWYG